MPAGVSGSGELNGGDFLVSLGLWDNNNFVGTDDGIAFTSMHELGHTLGLGHGGNSGVNCKPNYLSLMNYAFQLGGVIDARGQRPCGFLRGRAHHDRRTEPDGRLHDSGNVSGQAGTRRSPRVIRDQPLKRFCNGLKFDPLAPPPATIRIDGDVDKLTLLNKPIDWNDDGAADSGAQDVNFDGEPDAVPVPGEPSTTLTGYDDWANIRLNQVGSRRNFAGISIGPLGVKLLSDGSKLLSDGSVLLPDGSRLLADGSVLLADGTKLLADGAKFLADGSMLLADGSVLLADGVRLLSDGSRLLADGSKLLADGSKLLADGARLLADGSVLLADGSVLLADGTVFLADGSVLLADGVRFLSDGSMLLADGSPLLTSGIALAWHFAEITPQAAAESGTIGGPSSLTACVIGGSGVSACGPGAPTEPLHRVFLTWKAPHLETSITLCSIVPRATRSEPSPRCTIVPTRRRRLSWTASSCQQRSGTFTYVIEAVLDDDEDETVTPRSNEATITSENTRPVATAQSVTVWEDWPSDPITLAGTDVDSSGVAPFSVQNPSTQGGTVTASFPTVTYQSALNFNGADSFTFTVTETTTLNDENQLSEPAAVSLTVIPVNDKPNFTKGANQAVTQPAGAQTVAGWATGFDAGPPDEDVSQSVLQYIVTNNNNALFEPGGQPAIAAERHAHLYAEGWRSTGRGDRDRAGSGQRRNIRRPRRGRHERPAVVHDHDQCLAVDVAHVPADRRLDVDGYLEQEVRSQGGDPEERCAGAGEGPQQHHGRRHPVQLGDLQADRKLPQYARGLRGFRYAERPAVDQGFVQFARRQTQRGDQALVQRSGSAHQQPRPCDRGWNDGQVQPDAKGSSSRRTGP